MTKLKMRSKKALRKLRSSLGISPIVTCLLGCVVILQTLILTRMNDNRRVRQSVAEELVTDRDSKVKLEGTRLAPLTRTLQKSETESKSNPFDFQSCSCGLHFTVDAKKALLLPLPNNTGKKFLTIGIPTVKRRDGSYIEQTVTSLLNNMDVEQRKEVVIVIMIADRDPKARNATLRTLQKVFPEAITAGNLHLIAAPPELYTNFKVTKQTYGQRRSHVEWRSKQNFDYAYLMRYSRPLSLYYMQLEDDVMVAKNYVSAIRQYIGGQKDFWTCLEFSELGFIGKLFRSKDIDRLSQLQLMFFQEQPVDYIYLYFSKLMTQPNKRIRIPTLFQHLGIHSSLPGKIQRLKDRLFDVTKRHTHTQFVH